MNRPSAFLLPAALAGLVGVGCQGGSAGPQPSPGGAASGDATSATGTVHPRVKIQTTLGDIVVELNAEKAPLTVTNFLDYAADRYYDGTVFHRVVRTSLIHGGGFTPDMKEKSEGLKDAVRNESFNGLTNSKGTIAMFRRTDKADSATSQFYINVEDNPPLDQLRDGTAYTVFGRVIEGNDTLERIRNTPVAVHPSYAAGRNPVVPVKPVVIRSIRLLTPFDRERALALAKTAKVTPVDRLNALIAAMENDAGRPMVTTDSGLRYVDLKVGAGPFPLPEDTVDVLYRGTLLDGTEFDSSYRKSDSPISLKLRDAIKGLREGLESMREGGRRMLVVPPELGYGTVGVPGRVPPNSTLIFEIQLVEVKMSK